MVQDVMDMKWKKSGEKMVANKEKDPLKWVDEVFKDYDPFWEDIKEYYNKVKDYHLEQGCCLVCDFLSFCLQRCFGICMYKGEKKERKCEICMYYFDGCCLLKL
jgi:hypothetical protein